MPNYRFSGYQYETSPRKLKPEYEPQQNPYAKKRSSTAKQKQTNKVKEQNKQNNHKVQKNQIKNHIKIVFTIAVVFSALLAISYRNSLINESFNKNSELKAILATTQKENEQLQVNIENSLNLSNVEKLAKEKLGMKKLSNSQKVYVSLPKRDYVEPAVEEIVIEEDENWFQKIVNLLLNK